MLTQLNAWSHGFVSGAMIDCLLKRDFFALLARKTWSFRELVQEMKANSGYLRVALQVLSSCDLIKVEEEEITLLSSPAESFPFTDISSLYRIPFGELFHPANKARLFARLEELRRRPEGAFWEGVVLTPLFMALKTMPADTLDSFWEEADNDRLCTFLLDRKWLELKTGKPSLSPLGAQLLDRAYVLGVAASYRPMLAGMDELLFGSPERVFGRDAAGHETHVDRQVNVLASGSQHGRYFAEVESIVEELFNTGDLESQPRYLADMGCGDGTFLKRLYRIIERQTLRGRFLDSHPLTLIGIDYNAAALDATADNLKGLPHLLIRGDISRPQDLSPAFAEKGIDPESVLHIRSFLDHNRTYQDVEHYAHYQHVRLESVHLDAEGRLIPAAKLMTDLERHLARWGKVVNRHGLLLLESHCLPPAIVRQYLFETESLYFDAIHSFTSQYLVEAEKFVVAAAHAGLFLATPPKTYPKTLPFARITLGRYLRRDYRVRYALESDLEVLRKLERACWPAGLRTPVKEIRRRLEAYPEGQFVLEEDGRVLGVIYSQRIEDGKSLYHSSFQRLGRLHDPEGRHIQLLAINIFPDQQDRRLGDELLEFMLQRVALISGVEKVYGVSRCRDFAGSDQAEYEAYVRQNDEQGFCVDPILRFHQLHGAKIDGVAANFRPKDKNNLGHGVLIHYDIQNRQRFEGATFQERKAVSPIQSKETILTQIGGQVKRLLKSQDAYAPHYPLMEMGLDSGDLM